MKNQPFSIPSGIVIEEPGVLAARVLQTERTKRANGMQPGNPRIGRIAANPTAYASAQRGECECCNRGTHFVVIVGDRNAYWCGCETANR